MRAAGVEGTLSQGIRAFGHDPNQLAKLVVDIATGEAPESKETPPCGTEREKRTNAVASLVLKN